MYYCVILDIKNIFRVLVIKIDNFYLKDFADDDELILAMSELRQRRIDLKMSFDEFDSMWMLENMRKRRKMESFE